jgi:hypothetical protein
MDYDLVVVMENGKCVEFDHPFRLLQNPGGLFASFVDATGPESSADLRSIAARSWESRKT